VKLALITREGLTLEINSDSHQLDINVKSAIATEINSAKKTVFVRLAPLSRFLKTMVKDAEDLIAHKL